MVSERQQEELLEEAEEDLHDLRARRAYVGPVAQELELLALTQQLRAGYTAFQENLEVAARRAQKFGWASGRRYLITQCKADLHLLGRAASPAANWYVRTTLRSPIFSQRLLDGGELGREARARLTEYVEENFFRVGLDTVRRQLGGSDQEPLGA